MGLFGYGPKDYAKNTAAYTDQLNSILAHASVKQMGDGVGFAINNIIAALQSSDFPAGAKGKDLEAIDARIGTLISDMKGFLQTNSMARLSGYATMVLTAINMARAYGKEKRSDRQLAIEQQLADYKGQIADKYAKKKELIKQQEELEKKAGKYAEGSIEWEQCGQEWENIEAQKQSLDDQIMLFTTEHNEAVKTIATMDLDASFDELPKDIVSEAEFTRVCSNIARKSAERERRRGVMRNAREGATDAFRGSLGGSTGIGAGFAGKMAANRAKETEGSIESSTVAPSTSSSQAPGQTLSANNPFNRH